MIDQAEKSITHFDPEIQKHDLRVVEVRFRPSPRIIDQRGDLAEQLIKSLKLDNWEIGANSVQVASKDESVRCVIGFRNAFLRTLDLGLDGFETRMQHFFKMLLSQRQFSNQLVVQRLGVRQISAIPFEGAFNSLREKVCRISQLSPEITKQLGITGPKRIHDVALVHVFDDGDKRFRVRAGPMEESEFALPFNAPDDATFPEVGLFVDVDVYREEETTMPQSALIDRTKTFMGRAEGITGVYSRRILEG